MKKYKVLVIDDAHFMVKAITELLQSDPEIEVVGSARNGLEGLEKIKTLKPDVITLDMDMPVMDGIKAIRHIMIESPVPIVVLSSLFKDGHITFEALRLGVVDFLPKPSGAISKDIHLASQQIIDRVKIAISVKLKNIHRVYLGSVDSRGALIERYTFHSLDYLLAIGTTLGGPSTIVRLFSKLPPNLPAAALVVQEIAPQIIPAFVKKFNDYVPWSIEVAEDGVLLEQGVCYFASNEQTAWVDLNNEGKPCLRVTEKIPRPLDELFISAAKIFKHNAVGVLLTGVGNDGTQGFTKIKENTGTTIAQSTDTCVYPNLTQSVIELDVVDFIVDESQLVTQIKTIMR
ncbi:chemotaxis protein CheB [Candidatus Venteria ishoeyi]|uniref:protein-glutamate methylesterase n=1 Tax=Candidatus Venteria ishoeyi TaxID=1899563 RepID=A0A1H6F4P1_9GAMM|nr:chemotaxis protein CheB [Candidatus Venteria ishoeyi]MDM8547959.1 chemotaxis protein CheB [Candidatus Venteria ishoeyi]SEH05127.1 Chemotaxis response regulator protein-glutamate methylesterase [Candidatus Venteria ishoeyi]